MANNNTVQWIAIIALVITASASICFGVIKGADAKDMERHITRIDNQSVIMMELKTQSAVMETQLKYLSKQVQELNEVLRYSYGIGIDE